MSTLDWVRKDKVFKNREFGIEGAYMLDAFKEILQEL